MARRLAVIGLTSLVLGGCVPPTWRPSLENDVWAARAGVARPTAEPTDKAAWDAYGKAVAAAERKAALRWIPLGTPERRALRTLAAEHFVFLDGKLGDGRMELEEKRCLPWDCRGVRIDLTLTARRVVEVSAQDAQMEYDF